MATELNFIIRQMTRRQFHTACRIYEEDFYRFIEISIIIYLLKYRFEKSYTE